MSFVEIDSVFLRYELQGDGPSDVVMIHEMGTALESFDPVIGELLPGRRILRYDMRGFGRSERINGSITMADAVADLTGVLDAVGFTGPIDLIGGAVGGAVSIAFAAANPARVKSLVLLAPATGAEGERKTRAMVEAARTERIGIRALYEGGLMDIVYPQVLRADTEAYALFRALQYATDPVAVAATQRMIATTEFAPLLKAIRNRTLVVAGSLDGARRPEEHRRTADAIAGAAFAELPCGHFMGIQAPRQLAALLNDFLAG